MGRRKVRLGEGLRSSLERTRRRAQYIRLDDSDSAFPEQRRSGKGLRLGGARRAWSWKLPILRLRLRVRVRFVSPLVLLKRLRDAYERLMLRAAASGGSNQIFLANSGIYSMGIPGVGMHFIY